MFDRSRIMKTAWHYHRRFGQGMKQALSLAWREAKAALIRYNVIGQRFGREDEIIARGVTYERAGELEWFHRCRYDHIRLEMASGAYTIKG
ncbi:MAG: hypothetical protein PUD63_12305 [Clostridia bacterium]|nr:hypothetical protein [Clostridia bacterium]